MTTISLNNNDLFTAFRVKCHTKKGVKQLKTVYRMENLTLKKGDAYGASIQ